MSNYFKTFPKVKELMDKLSNEARVTKIAKSPLDGRQIDLSAIDWDDPGYVAHALNQAKNLPFQGTGASVTKLALCFIDEQITQHNYDAQIVNVIHDEILVTCHVSIADEVKKMVEREMIRAFNFYCPNVKMAVVAEIGTHWIH